MSSPQHPPPSGWYPDPRDGTRLRFWDGAAWGESVPAPPVVGYGDFGSWFAATFTVLFSRVLAALVLLFVLPGIAFSVVLLSVRSFVADLGYDNVDDEFVGFDGGALVVLIGLALLALVVSLVGYLGAHADLYAAHVGRPQSIAQSLAQGIRALPRAVLWILILALVAGIGGLVLIGLPILLAVTAGAGFAILLVLTVPVLIVAAVYLGVRLGFAMTAIAVGPKGINPIVESWRLTGNRWIATFLRLLLLWGTGYFLNATLQGALSVFATAAVPDDVEFGEGGDEVRVDGVPVGELDFVDFEVFLPGAWVFLLVALVYALGNALSQAVQISGSTALYGRADGKAR